MGRAMGTLSIVRSCLTFGLAGYGLANEAAAPGESGDQVPPEKSWRDRVMDPWGDTWVPEENSSNKAAVPATDEKVARWYGVDLEESAANAPDERYVWPEPVAERGGEMVTNILNSYAHRTVLGQVELNLEDAQQSALHDGEKKRQDERHDERKRRIEHMNDAGKGKEKRKKRPKSGAPRDPNFEHIKQVHEDETRRRKERTAEEIPADLRLDRFLRLHAERSGSHRSVRQVFDSLDADGNGYLQLNELNASSFRGLTSVDVGDLLEQLKGLDQNQDGRVFFDTSENQGTRVHSVLDKLTVMDTSQNIHDMILDELSEKKRSHDNSASVVYFVLATMLIAGAVTFAASSSRGASMPKCEEKLLSKVGPPKSGKAKAVQGSPKVQRRRKVGGSKGASPASTTNNVSKRSDWDQASPSDKGAALLSMLANNPSDFQLDGAEDPAVLTKVTIQGGDWLPVLSPREKVDKRKTAGAKRRAAPKQQFKSSTSAWQRAVPAHLGGTAVNTKLVPDRSRSTGKTTGVPDVPALQFDELNEADTERGSARKAILSPSAQGSSSFGGRVSPGVAFADLPRTPSNSVLSSLDKENFGDAVPKPVQADQPPTEQIVPVSQHDDVELAALNAPDGEEDVDLVSVETVVFMGKYYLVDCNSLEVYNFNDGVDEIINPEPIGHWNCEMCCVLFFNPPEELMQQLSSPQLRPLCMAGPPSMPAGSPQTTFSAPVSPPLTDSAPSSNDGDAPGSSDDGESAVESANACGVSRGAIDACAQAMGNVFAKSNQARQEQKDQMDILAQNLESQGRIKPTGTAAGPPV